MKHLRFLFSSMVLSLGVTTTAVKADPIIVELFTSQGCSSCPPADRLLHEMAQAEDILPLSLHVDYWDYLGWPDAFARPENTERQKRYARLERSKSLFTPHLVVGGDAHIAGAKPMALSDAIAKTRSEVSNIALRLGSSPKGTTVMAPSYYGKPVDLILITYLPQATVKIKAGENAGKTLTYRNIVRDWRVLRSWTGEEALSLAVPEAAEGFSQVLIAQDKGQGPMRASLKIEN